MQASLQVCSVCHGLTTSQGDRCSCSYSATWRKTATDKLVEKIVKHDSWPIQPDILNPSLLRLTSRNLLWLDWHQKSMRHNWKSAQVVNSHLVRDPQSSNQVLTSLGNGGLYWTIFARNRDIAVPVKGTSDLQTLTCVLAARPKQCPTLSNPVLWQSWMVAYPGCTLDEATVSWLTNYGLWHAYEKKKNNTMGYSFFAGRHPMMTYSIHEASVTKISDTSQISSCRSANICIIINEVKWNGAPSFSSINNG